MELQLKQPQQSDPAFVLGNGVSRLSVDTNYLLRTGTVYGCNAIYRECEPNYLIAVDVKMINEIIAAGYHKNHAVWTNPNKGVTTKHGINFFTPHKGWSSGPTALWFAATHGYKNIFIFGFDYQGVQGKFNNVYADTFNYKKSTDTATFHGNWASQTEKVIKEFKNINFFRVVENNGYVPDKLTKDMPNLKHLNFTEFEQMYPGSIYKDQIHQKTTI